MVGTIAVNANPQEGVEPPGRGGSFVLTSPVAGADGVSPAAYTCGGAGISPPLPWTGPTKS